MVIGCVSYAYLVEYPCFNDNLLLFKNFQEKVLARYGVFRCSVNAKKGFIAHVSH